MNAIGSLDLPPPARMGRDWALGTAAGATGGAILCQLLLGERPRGASFVLLMPLLMGAAVGLGQWLTLRETLPLPKVWILVSALGWLPAPLFYLHPARHVYVHGYDDRHEYGYRPPSWLPDFQWPELAVPSLGAFAGLGLGLLQAFLLPRLASRGAWIAASAVGYLAGGLLSLLVGPTLLGAFAEARASLGGHPVQDVLEALLGLADPAWYGGCLGLVAGLATAWAIARAPAPEPQMPKSPAPTSVP